MLPNLLLETNTKLGDKKVMKRKKVKKVRNYSLAISIAFGALLWVKVYKSSIKPSMNDAYRWDYNKALDIYTITLLGIYL